jgi:hypothetical protein
MTEGKSLTVAALATAREAFLRKSRLVDAMVSLLFFFQHCQMKRLKFGDSPPIEIIRPSGAAHLSIKCVIVANQKKVKVFAFESQ